MIARAEALTAKPRITKVSPEPPRLRLIASVTPAQSASALSIQSPHGKAERMSMNTVRVSGVDACIRRSEWLER